MNSVRDAWYVRLPGGQEIKAKSTTAVLHHVENGTIPKNSYARRSRDEEWQQLEWVAEFTEAITGIKRPHESVETAPAPPPAAPPKPAPMSGLATRLDPMRLRTVGVRGLLDDLVAALDATFIRDKLLVAAVAGALIGLIWGGVPWAVNTFFRSTGVVPGDWAVVWLHRFVRLGMVVPSIIVLAWANGLLAHMTHMELANMRRVDWRSALAGYMTHGIRLTLGYLIVLGGAFLAMSVLRWLPEFTFDVFFRRMGLGVTVAKIVPVVLSVIGVIMEAILWLLVGLTWLLAPLLVGEEYSLGKGLREWLALIRGQFNRIVLAETLTLALGVLIAVPIVAPVDYALGHYGFLPYPLRTMALGLAASGFLAFMAVANVFTYLDVKYESH